MITFNEADGALVNSPETISTRTISSATPGQIQILFGVQDRNLKQLEKEFPVKIIGRGGKMVLSGSDQTLDIVEPLVESLLKKVQQAGRLTTEDLAQQIEKRKIKFLKTQFENEVSPQGKSSSFSREEFPIAPRSQGQARYLRAIDDHDLVFCSGPAGSGKTYLAVAMALYYLKIEQVRKIVLVRPAVEAGEKLGFLPGDMLAKVNPFLRPLLDALRDMLDYKQVQQYLDHDVIEIVPLAFMRGRTLNETFMILDEAQNTTVTQMKMFLTRMGNGSKIVVTGDETQNDLPAHVSSGLNDAMQRLKSIPGAACVQLHGEDIVRHRLVREIVKAYDQNVSS